MFGIRFLGRARHGIRDTAFSGDKIIIITVKQDCKAVTIDKED